MAFRKKVYVSVEELQQDVDEWMEWYNRERTHSGRHCGGRTPFQTLRETKHLVYQKMLDRQVQQKESDTNDHVTTPVPIVG